MELEWNKYKSQLETVFQRQTEMRWDVSSFLFFFLKLKVKESNDKIKKKADQRIVENEKK